MHNRCLLSGPLQFRVKQLEYPQPQLLRILEQIVYLWH